MTFAAQIRWQFRGAHQLGVVIHARNENHAWARLYQILPATVFRAEHWEIAMCDLAKLLEPLQESEESNGPLYRAA